MLNHKHKVAFYFVLVILLMAFRQCHSTKEIIGDYQSGKNTTAVRSIDDGSISGKLQQLRSLTRSLIFDWNFGESKVEGKL